MARARQLAARFGRELRIARTTAGLTQAQLARLADVGQQEVSKAENGSISIGLPVRCKLASACGSELGWRLYPASTVRLRDSGQLEIANEIVGRAHADWMPELEHVIAPGDLRAADLLFFHPLELVHVEVERGLVDFQGQLRLAQQKRQVIAQQDARPVRLVLAVPDTASTRHRLEPHMELIRGALPVPSRQIWSALGAGEPIGGDGLLFVRKRRRTSRSS